MKREWRFNLLTISTHFSNFPNAFLTSMYFTTKADKYVLQLSPFNTKRWIVNHFMSLLVIKIGNGPLNYFLLARCYYASGLWVVTCLMRFIVGPVYNRSKKSSWGSFWGQWLMTGLEVQAWVLGENRLCLQPGALHPL